MIPVENKPLSLRKISREARQAVARLIHSRTGVHRHLGWRTPLDWLGHQPYLGVYKGKQMAGALACPPDEDGITWLRLLAAAPGEDPGEIWGRLWPAARDALAGREGVASLNALALQPWVADLLPRGGFRKTYEVIIMDWDSAHAADPPAPEDVQIRKMKEGDLEDVYRIDRAAFDPLWRNSLHSLGIAYQAAYLASVALVDERIAGYQISTVGTLGGHLARLAVHPRQQNRGVGTAMVGHGLRALERMGVVRVSVNTQKSNLASLELYQKFGFQRQGESYPVFQHFF
ncbi:MAG: GNAT family N-acetyltransferase [Anaerolineales bacterium]